MVCVAPCETLVFRRDLIINEEGYDDCDKESSSNRSSGSTADEEDVLAYNMACVTCNSLASD